MDMINEKVEGVKEAEIVSSTLSIISSERLMFSILYSK
jgi:hypothetical protein